jgi:hypothetical protein
MVMVLYTGNASCAWPFSHVGVLQSVLMMYCVPVPQENLDCCKEQSKHSTETSDHYRLFLK